MAGAVHWPNHNARLPERPGPLCRSPWLLDPVGLVQAV
jgi:hypothetical protein